MMRRLLVSAVTLALGAVFIGWVSRTEARVVRVPLAQLPLQIAEWRGRDYPEFEQKVLNVLGVDDHVHRLYMREGGTASLYIGYYDSQRTGDTIHSPMKCLPGTGWQPLSVGRTQIEVRDASSPAGKRVLDVNRYIVQKGTDRYVVLFWYQSHGYVIASEYVAKARLMVDAVRVNRTDGALVRVIVPISDQPVGATPDQAAAEFVAALFPLLPRHLPS